MALEYKGFELPKPLLYYVLVEMDTQFVPDEIDEVTGESIVKSQGGIILSRKTAQQDANNSAYGTIVALGDCVWSDFFQKEVSASNKPPYKVGDHVMLRAFSGYNVMPLPNSKKFAIGRFQLVTDQNIVALL